MKPGDLVRFKPWILLESDIEELDKHIHGQLGSDNYRSRKNMLVISRVNEKRVLVWDVVIGVSLERVVDLEWVT